MKALTGKELARILERNGWALMHVRGSHHRYEKPGSRPVTVPVLAGKTLPTGLQRSIMRDGGLTEDDL
jgi:predicted RNA binding protein YcfA (HicA-like mRNA interferase family)